MAPPETRDDVDRYLQSLDAPALRSLLRDVATRDPAVDRMLRIRASARSGAPDRETAKRLTAAVSDALRVRGFVDYRRSFHVARDANELLDELQDHLDAGAADTVRPALERATTRLRSIIEQADDSAGVLGDAGQRALDLHARSAREGDPDGRALARWLVKFRSRSPGWPTVTLDDHLDGLGDAGLAAYRKAVAALAPGSGTDSYDVMTMRLELADHDGDVDAAIELLQDGSPGPGFGGIIRRLRAAGRDDEVLGWMERARAAGRVRALRNGPNDYWIDPTDVADTLVAAGRPDDAIETLRSEFTRQPSREQFAALLALGGRLDRAAGEREWALTHARSRTGSFEQGAVLVDLALAEDDLGAAWEAADEFGAGYRWRELADASRESLPLSAAQLYRADADRQLSRGPDTKMYGPVAETLVLVRDLHRAAHAEDEFAAYLADVRKNYGRWPSLLRELDRRGL